MARRKRSQKRGPQQRKSHAEDRLQTRQEKTSPPPPPPPRTASLVTVACLVVIVVVTILSFTPAIDNGFLHWDDDNNLMKNTHIRGFSAENLKWMWTSSLLGVWQPLTWMITTVEYRLFDGANLAKFSRGMHVASIGLHSVAVMLVFFVVRRLIALGAAKTAADSPVGLSLGAALAALLFAVHPLRVETVAWASGQPYVLALIPALATVWCYLLAQQAGRRRWHAAALACLAASLLCKALAVPLVAVLLVLDVYPLRRFGGLAGWRPRVVLRVLLEKVPYAALTLVVIGLTVWATWEHKSYKHVPISTKLLTASFCMLFYVSLTFAPYRLAPYYWGSTFFAGNEALRDMSALTFVVVTVLFVVLRRRLPWLLTTWTVYVLVLLPVVGLVKHGGQITADRYSYLSCIGWAALTGALGLRIWAGTACRARSVRRAIVVVIALGIVAGLRAQTRAYCGDYEDSVSLWSAMVERNPRYHMGYYNLAKANKRPCRNLLQRARQAEREDDTETAARLHREASERYRAAEKNYRKAIELYPLYPDANVDLGNMIKAGLVTGGAAAAEERYRTALRGRPGFHMAHFNLGTLMMKTGRYDEALDHLQLAMTDAERSDKTKLPMIRRALARAREKVDRP